MHRVIIETLSKTADTYIIAVVIMLCPQLTQRGYYDISLVVIVLCYNNEIQEVSKNRHNVNVCLLQTYRFMLVFKKYQGRIYIEIKTFSYTSRK